MRLVSIGLIGSLLFVGSAEAGTIERTVKANMRTVVGGFSATDLNTCYTLATPNWKLDQPPANGTIDVQVHEWTNKAGERCSGSKSRGPVIIYTPKKGFKGRDEATISFTSTEPGMSTYTYQLRLNVE